MGLAFTPQTSSPTPTPEATLSDVTLEPGDDFFEVEQTPPLEMPPLAPEQADTSVEPEQPAEMLPQQPEQTKIEVKTEGKPKTTRPPTPAHPSTLKQVDPITAQIEKIMEEGIGEAYQELTPVQKQQFKIKGEETARGIKMLLQTSKIKIKKIFNLLLEWLKLLPGVNRFFLMQEAKIKTDKILGLKHNSH